MKILITLLVGYLLGSLNFSLIIGYLLFGKDVRSRGSGNAGATNMARSFGIVPGLLTLAGDVIKTLAAIQIGVSLCGYRGLLFAGIACLIGHCFPVFFRFEGGKGVAVGAAIFFACGWKVGLCALIVFFLVALLSRKVSLSSVLASLSGIALAFLLGARGPRLALILFTGFVVVLMHLDNIKRLLNGTEPDFSCRRK